MNVRRLLISTYLVWNAQAALRSYGEGDGLIGLGLRLYEPYCAFACVNSVKSPLNCTTISVPKESSLPQGTKDSSLSAGNGWLVARKPPVECQYNNRFYLQTVAWCLKGRCAGELASRLESFWEINVPSLRTDDPPMPVKPSYGQVISSIRKPPKRPLNNKVVLNYTAVVPDQIYMPEYDRLRTRAANENAHEWYGLVIFLSGVVLPVGLSLLRFVPWPASWVTKFNGHFIHPPLVGTKHSTPVWGLGIMPTRGQALFLAYFWLINIVLSALSFENGNSPSHEVINLVAKRQGVLSFALLPLVMLYAGRNNLLIWLTDWSHSTFLLLHRWTGFLCMFHAVIHSLCFLHLAVARIGKYDHAKKILEPYWYWGIVGTLSMAIIIPMSLQLLRRRMYELFLVSHIALAAVALVGCFKHIDIKFGSGRGYNIWIWIAIALWLFDRSARLVRILRGGLTKRAYLTPIDDDYYRIDIPGVTTSGHVYLYFPSVPSWRIWENHPFSVAGVTYSRPRESIDDQSRHELGDESVKEAHVTGTSRRSGSISDATDGECASKPGIVLFVRRRKGITGLLAEKCKGQRGLPVLLEGPYLSNMALARGSVLGPSHRFPHLICIAGGVGISGVLPALDSFSTMAKPNGSIKLFWGVRAMPLVHAVEGMLGHACEDTTKRQWGRVDVTLAVGHKFDLADMLQRELRSKKFQCGTTVVVCGPSAMIDEVRCTVAGLERHDGDLGPVRVKLAVENFSW